MRFWFGLGIIILAGFVWNAEVVASAGPEQRVIRDYVAQSFGYTPTHIGEEVKVIRVRKQYDGEIILELENGHSYNVKVELRSY